MPPTSQIGHWRQADRTCRICGSCRPSYLCASARIPLTMAAIVNPALAFLPASAAELCAIVCPRRPTCACTPERPVPEGVSAALTVRSIPVAARPGGSNWRPQRIIVRFVRHRPSACCQRAAAASPLGCHDGSRDRPGGQDWRGYPQAAGGVSWPASATAASSAANSSDQPLKGIAGRSL
jgi:hypothetical protein